MTELELQEKAVEERRRYFREWKRNHKDKVREYNRSYWERRAAKMMQSENEKYE